MSDFSAVFLFVLLFHARHILNLVNIENEISFGIHNGNEITKSEWERGSDSFVSYANRSDISTNTTLSKRRFSRHLNIEKYHEDIDRYSAMSLGSFVIEILPQSSFRPTPDRIIHIRFRIRTLNKEYNPQSFYVHTYSIPENQIIEFIPKGYGYTDTIFSLNIKAAIFNEHDTKVMIVVISNDLRIDTRLIKIRRDLEQFYSGINSLNRPIDLSIVSQQSSSSSSSLSSVETSFGSKHYSKSEINYSILNSCRNIWFRNCEDVTWSFEFSIIDKYGILEITSNPYTISLSNDFFSGIQKKIHGYSVASCCLDRIELITLNIFGENTTKVISSNETNFSTTNIVIAVLLTIFIIIVLVSIIAFIMYRRSQNQSSDLPIFSSSRNL